ncbi:MAG: hypothetical protein HY089_12905 [Ignavibacteriales bacterium]|nr:hypothetical protein [Ignavibacteriales bacterium]
MILQSSNILTEIKTRLAQTRMRQNAVDAQSGALVFGILLLAAAVAIGLAELAFALSSTGRTILFFSFSMFTLGIAAWKLALPLLRYFGLLRSQNDFQTAEHVGKFFPSIRDRLLNLLQLNEEILSGKSPYSPELVDASFEDLSTNIRSLDFTESVDETPIRRSLKLFALSATGAILLVIALPSALYQSFYRIAHFSQEFTPPPTYVLEVSPGNKEIVKGEAVQVNVTVRSSVFSPLTLREATLQLNWRLEGQTNYERASLHADSSGGFSTTLQNLRASTEYFASLADAQSEHYKLTVIDRPVLRALQIRLNYPSYTKLPPKIQDEFVGDITALAGTNVSLGGSASKTIKEGRIEFGNGKSVALNVAGQKFSATFALDQETTYRIELTDAENLENANPVWYQIKLVPDEPPTITILQPGRNLDITGDQPLRLLLQSKDDFGLSSMRLGYRLVQSRYEPPAATPTFVTIPISAQLETQSGTQVEVPFTWDITKLHLVPEDVVEYFAEVFDNDAVHGPKSARSSAFIIRLPSLEEVFAEADKGHEKSIEDLKRTLEDAKQLKEKIEAINQDVKKNKEMDWQQQKKMEEMAKKYQDMQKKLQDVQKRVDEMVQKMDQQNVLSKETMEKYMELQQMFEQLNSAELQQAMKQMQQAMQNVNKDQLQQAMQKMSFSEEQFRNSIERTMELLKRIQIEQKMDEVKKRAEELQRLQKDLKEQTAQAQNDQQKLNDLAKQQSDLAKKQEELQNEAANLQKKMEEFFGEMPVDKMQKLNEKMSQQQLGEKMKQTGKQMQQGQRQQAGQQQQQIQQQLGEMAQELQSLQNELLQQQAQHAMNELRRAINNLLELSQREESLKNQSQNAPTNSPQLRQNAQDQMRVLQDLSNVISGLGELSKRSFAVTPEMGRAIGEAIQRMQAAMNGLDARNGMVASQEQGAAMGSLNKAATAVQKAMEQMMQGSSGGMGGLMQQLQNMAGQQQSINMQTQSMQQAAEAARLAVEQEAVRKSLEQLNKEAQASKDGERVLGDLEKIGEEMREVVKNLEQNNVNPETIKKQERILSRLLDASKSMRERDYEKKRKAETGTQLARRSPNELDPNTLEGRNKLRDDLLKAIEQGYSKDYQELIRKYFEELGKSRIQ